MGQHWFLEAPDDQVRARGDPPGFGGFYAADECRGELARSVFGHYQRMKSVDPDGMTVGTLLASPELMLWRDSVDVLATDPYPLYGAEPKAGYDLSMVSQWTHAARTAVHDSRPILTTIQFFQSTLNSRWPTKQELRNMSYMAIAEGANGLLYWSLGARGLAWVCPDWCDAKKERFESLKSVLEEVQALAPALAAIDDTRLLTRNQDSGSIRTRVKYVDGTAYIIASNITGRTLTNTFDVASAPVSVTVYREHRTITPDKTQFTDQFGPYEAHVYVLSLQ
jgi:hypothetical protein